MGIPGRDDESSDVTKLLLDHVSIEDIKDIHARERTCSSFMVLLSLSMLQLLRLVVALIAVGKSVAFFGFNGAKIVGGKSLSPKLDKATAAAEAQLLSILEATEAISGSETKLTEDQLRAIQDAIKLLEGSKSGIQEPISSPLLDGTWKLLYTSSPGTNSPIQRKVTSTKGISVYQVVNLLDTSNSFLPDQLPDISNTVLSSPFPLSPTLTTPLNIFLAAMYVIDKLFVSIGMHWRW